MPRVLKQTFAAERKRRYRRNCKARGHCVRCGQHAQTGTTCDRCKEKMKATSRKYRHGDGSNGFCDGSWFPGTHVSTIDSWVTVRCPDCQETFSRPTWSVSPHTVPRHKVI